MSIGQPAPDVCPRCGALVPQKLSPPTEAEPDEFVCRPEEYDPQLHEHDKVCPGKPQDDESKARLEKIKKTFRFIRTVSTHS